MKKNGFTLVELIAVIVILGLIGLIIVPSINSTLKKQREKTFQTSVSGLLATVKGESQSSGFTTKYYRFDANKLFECDTNGENCSGTASLTTQGKIIDGEGYVRVTKDGLYSLYIKNDSLCSFKTYYNEITTTSNKSLCDFGNLVAVAIDRAIYYNNDGLYRDFYIKSGLMTLVHEGELSVDPAIEVKNGIDSSVSGEIETEGINVGILKIESTSFCAYNDTHNSDDDASIKIINGVCHSI